MAIVLWDVEGMPVVDVLELSSTMKSDGYCETLKNTKADNCKIGKMSVRSFLIVMHFHL